MNTPTPSLSDISAEPPPMEGEYESRRISAIATPDVTTTQESVSQTSPENTVTYLGEATRHSIDELTVPQLVLLSEARRIGTVRDHASKKAMIDALYPKQASVIAKEKMLHDADALLPHVEGSSEDAMKTRGVLLSLKAHVLADIGNIIGKHNDSSAEPFSFERFTYEKIQAKRDINRSVQQTLAEQAAQKKNIFRKIREMMMWEND